MSTMIDDLRFGLRLLGRNSGFTVIAVLTLALGIGGNTAIFSVVNGVLLQPLPYRDPGRLVVLYERTQTFTYGSVAYPNLLDWRDQNRSFTDIAAFRAYDFNFTGSGGPEHLVGEHVSAGLFRILGVEPLFGRGFSPEEDRRGASGVVMLSYGLWQRRFGGDRDILGQSLALNGRDYTIIGVLPSDFRFREQADLYLPLGQLNVALEDRGNHPGLHALARLKPGVSLAAARADMSSVAGGLATEYPESNLGHSVTVVPMHDDLVGRIRPTLLLLLGAVGFVLIIACANVANLLLARATTRRRELAVRTSLGADRRRLVRQLLTESVMLGVASGGLGLLLAHWGTRLILAAIPDRLPHTQQVAMDRDVLLFTLAVSLLTGLVFGIAPAFHGSNVNPMESLKEGARTSGRGRRRAEGIFVALQIGLAVVLLAGAGLMIQSIWRLSQVDTGFDASRVLTARMALSPTVAASPSKIRTAFRETLARVDGIAGVSSDAAVNIVPLSGEDQEVGAWLGRGPQPPPDQMDSALIFVTTPDYLQVMGIPLLSGRFLTDRDTNASPPVAVIDEVMARHLFPNEDPVGREVSLAPLGAVRIVGVARHVKHWGLDIDDGAVIRDQIYTSLFQVPDQYTSEVLGGASLLIRTEHDPLNLLSAVRDQVAGPADDQPIYAVRTMKQIISGSLAARRFTMLLLTVFASTALLMAALGIYGVMAYAVGRRTQELGVRIALGATRADVLRLVMREGMALVVIGMAIGVPVALGLTRLLANMLYGVQPTDPATLFVVSLTLVGVAFVASYVPARRATKVDPMAALRCE